MQRLMHRITGFAVGLTVALAASASLLASSARAQGAPKDVAKPADGDKGGDKGGDKDVIDLKAQAKDYRVLTSEAGQFYVVPLKYMSDAMVFFGDGKTMYQQRIIGSGSSDGALDFSMWAPRVVGLQQASIDIKADGSATAYCNSAHPTKLVPASPADSARVLGKAVFKAPLWKRQAKFLARDNTGVYFYVDVLRDGGKGHRVYVGAKGQMKQMPMTTLVDDAAGQIYGTKRGELRIVANTGDKATWRKGKKVEELVVLEPSDNLYLIYRELGIYGQLGSICDDE